MSVQAEIFRESRDVVVALPFLHAGKVRDTYALTEYPHLQLIVATDRISAFDEILQGGIPRKGVILTRMSAFWLQFLQDVCPNHFVTDDTRKYPASCAEYQHVLQGRSMIVHRCFPLPIECIVRGHLTGSYYSAFKKAPVKYGKTESPVVSRAYKTVHGNDLSADMLESQSFTTPLFTPSTKAEIGAHDENISTDHMADLLTEWLEKNEISLPMGAQKLCSTVQELSISLYNKAYRHAYDRGIVIADTKFEYGLMPDGKLMLIDEVLTPDSSRFWLKDEVAPGAKSTSFDKQFVRDWLTKNWIDRTQSPPPLPEDVVRATTQRYESAYYVLAH